MSDAKCNNYTLSFATYSPSIIPLPPKCPVISSRGKYYFRLYCIILFKSATKVDSRLYRTSGEGRRYRKYQHTIYSMGVETSALYNVDVLILQLATFFKVSRCSYDRQAHLLQYILH